MRKVTGTLFGTWLRKQRKDRGWSLEKFAEMVGTHKGYVSGIENFKCAPPAVGVIRNICRAFGLKGDVITNAVLRAWIDKSPMEIRETLMAVFGKELA